MSVEDAPALQPVRVIVVANEKGGSGKSTIAMHVAIALMKRGQRVATIDLDTRQRSFTHYLDNRRAWAAHVARELPTPEHYRVDSEGDGEAALKALVETIDDLAPTYDYVVIDTPGHDSALMRQAHAVADTLMTPVNDSFIDLDVLGGFEPETLAVTHTSHYANTVLEGQAQRVQAGKAATDWIVLRNRLSMTPSRNKRFVGAALQALSEKLGFRCIEGIAERVIFRELYLRGLTALDDLDETLLGTRPTMSHVTARQEIEALLDAMQLSALAPPQAAEQNLDAA